MDAIDTALVRIGDTSLELIEYEQYPIDDAIRRAVRDISSIKSIDEVSRYDVILGDLFADAVQKIVVRSNLRHDDIIAIGSHGQTILHLPDDDNPRTLQIGDANIIASKTGITTVADFRRMDMAYGGQGAPLTPAFHAFQFRSSDVDRIILNIGGIANITLLPAEPAVTVTGFDTGPGNGLLDDWNRLHNETAMDKDSAWAASGNEDIKLLQTFLNDPYFSLEPPKSTGRDQFNLEWLNNRMEDFTRQVQASDVQATLVKLTSRSIADAIKAHAGNAGEIYVCGGGAHNPVLLEQLSEQLNGVRISTTDELGIEADAVEAVTFAWLAKQRMEGLSGNLPSVTGAKKPVILGAIYEPVTSNKL